MEIISVLLGIIGIALASTILIINEVEIYTLIISLSGLAVVIIGLILGIKVFKEKRKNNSKKGIEIAGIIICTIMTIILLFFSGVLIVEGYIIINSPDDIKASSITNSIGSSKF